MTISKRISPHCHMTSEERGLNCAVNVLQPEQKYHYSHAINVSPAHNQRSRLGIHVSFARA